MRKIGILILFSLIFTSSLFSEEKTLTFATAETHSPPYLMGTGNSIIKENPGVFIELLQLLEQNLDINIEFERYPHLRAIKCVQNGLVDGFFSWSFKQTRLKIAQFPMVEGRPDPSKRIVNASYAIYKLNDSNVEWDGKAFKNLSKPIGVQRQYSIANILKKKYKVRVEDVTQHTSQNFERLMLGRVSAVVDIEMSADIILNSNALFRKNIIKMSPLLVTKPYYLVLSHQFVKEHPEFAEKIWSALEEIREKHLLRLMKKYSK